MSSADTSFYVTGGTLRPDAPSYVERQADKDLFEGLLNGEFCYVLTSRQMGKSSLMVRTANKLRAKGNHVIALDLTAIGQNLTLEQWYNGFLTSMGEQAGLEDELEQFWIANERLSPVQRWFTAIRKTVLAWRPGPAVIFLDEIDTVRSLPFSTDEFFAAIRECYNRRSEAPEFNRLTFCLLGVATPTDLIRDTRLTPFNVGRRIELNDFTSQEATQLALGLERGDPEAVSDGNDPAPALLARILYWTDGHPYLTQRLCRAVAEAKWNSRERNLEHIKFGTIDRLCEELFLSHRARELDTNLVFVRERLLRSHPYPLDLLERYGEVFCGKRVADDLRNPLVDLLRLAGVTKGVEGFLQVRNRIYAQVFDLNWLRENIEAQRARAGDRAVNEALATLREFSASLATEQPAPQQKQVTVLLAEFSGLLAGPESVRRIEPSQVGDAMWKRLTGAVTARGGKVEGRIGGTLTAMFGGSVKREDEPEQAVRVALAMQAEWRDIQERIRGTLRAPCATQPASGSLTPSLFPSEGERFPLPQVAPCAAEPTPDPSQEGSFRDGDECLLPFREGPGVGRLMGGVADPERPRLRIAVHTGPVILAASGEMGRDAQTQDTIQCAQRLLQGAPGDAVVISHGTYCQLRGLFEAEPFEPLHAQAARESAPVYRVHSAKPRVFQPMRRRVEGLETRMIGREAELKRLQDQFTVALEDRELQIATVVGDAGIGKSRLLYEFNRWLEPQRHTLPVFNGRASEEMGGLPFSLLRDVLAFRFEIQDSDRPAVARQKLEQGVIRILGAGRRPDSLEADEASKAAHFIGHLVGLDFSASPHLRGILNDAKQIRDRAFQYLTRFFRAAAAETSQAKAGAVLLLEDIHWADNGSLDLIDHLVRTCHVAPLFILCLTRPTLFERRPGWGEGESAHQRLSLPPLSKRECRQLVEEILRKARDIPPALRELVVAGSEGNPFYLEELVKTLIEAKVIVPEADHWWVDLGRLPALRVPPTLAGLLQARLDRLSARERALLQRASVLGRVFWDSAVDAFRSEQDQPRSMLAQSTTFETLESLRRKEMIFRREASAFAGTTEYTFRHALLRDVIYQGMLEHDRAKYHAKAASWLIEHSGERASEFAGVVAGHFEAADDTTSAAHWFGRAGNQARAAWAPQTAIDYYQKALAFTSVELSVHAEPAPSLHGSSPATGEYASDILIDHSYPEPTPAPSREGSNTSWPIPLLGGVRGGFVSDTFTGKGLSDGASHDLKRGILSRAPDCLDWYAGLGESLVAQARFAEAAHAYQSMRAAAEAIGDKVAEAQAWNGLAFVQERHGTNRASVECATRAASLARQAGVSVAAQTALARALFLKGWAFYRLGDAALLLELGEQALALSIQLGADSERINSLKLIAVGHLQLGRHRQAGRYFEQALELARSLGARRNVGAMLSNLGECARAQGDYRSAIGYYQEAIAVAREIGSRESELLYVTNLAGARVALGGQELAVAEADLRQVITQEGLPAFLFSETYRFLAEALLGQNKVAEAFEIARQALARGKQTENRDNIASAWRALGCTMAHPKFEPPDELDASLKRLNPAACFAESLKIFWEMGAEAEQARTLRVWANYELAHGDQGRGAAMRQAAREIFGRLEMELEVERMNLEEPNWVCG